MTLRVHDLSLPRTDGSPDGTHLRQFLSSVIAARSRLELPLRDEPLLWESVGVVLPEGCADSPLASSIHDLYQRMHVCLNLPEEHFRKPDHFVVKEEVIRSKPGRSKLIWAVTETSHSKAFAEAAQRQPTARIVDLQKYMKNHYEPLWETAFQSGNVVEYIRQEVG